MESGKGISSREWRRPASLFALLGVVVVGAALRLASLNTRSFWLDETTAVRQASWPLQQMVEWQTTNVHPPLFHTLLHFWIRTFGSSEVAVRSFALAWGLVAIPLVYWVAVSLFDRRTAVFSAGVVALSPFFIWYSQEARMYTMMLVFALVGTGALWRALRTGRVSWWVLYALAAGLGMMTQYFSAFLILGHAVYVLWFEVRNVPEAPDGQEPAEKPGRRRFTLIAWTLSMAAAMAPLALWLPLVLRNREIFRGVSGAFNYGGTPPALGVHFDSQALVIAQWLFGFHSTAVMRGLVASWPLLITVAFVLGGLAKRMSPATRFLAVSGIVAASAISALGIWQPIVLEVRYYTAACVPMALMAGRLLAEMRPATGRTVTALLLIVALGSWFDQSYNPDNIVKWDNRAAMGVVADGFRDGDVVLLLPYFVSSVPEYYLPPDIYAAVETVPLFDRFGRERNSVAQLSEDLRRQVGNADRVWVVSTWTQVPQIETDRRHVGQWLGGRDYDRVQDHPLRQIRVELWEAPPAAEEPDFFKTGEVAP